MWEYRELIKNLTVAELRNRYQNTTLGFLWTLLSPFLLATVLWFIFRNLFDQEENFAINLIVGIMAWRFFANGTMAALFAVVSRPSLVTKVYLPRKILVLSSVLANLVTSIFELAILLPLIIVLADFPATALLFPLVTLLFFWIVYGTGLLLGALYVYFRDVHQIWDVMLTMLFFLSPIVYPISIISEGLLKYYMLNPITRVIEMHRDVMVAGVLPSASDLLVVVGAGLALTAGASLVFERLQRRFAEAM